MGRSSVAELEECLLAARREDSPSSGSSSASPPSSSDKARFGGLLGAAPGLSMSPARARLPRPACAEGENYQITIWYMRVNE